VQISGAGSQPHKLIYALIWLHVTPPFKIVHSRGADRAQNYIALIEHRELNDRPIEVVTTDLALLQRHCKCSISESFIATANRVLSPQFFCGAPPSSPSSPFWLS
jgi:hypothetical protein